jgi:hypothetical protein
VTERYSRAISCNAQVGDAADWTWESSRLPQNLRWRRDFGVAVRRAQ